MGFRSMYNVLFVMVQCHSGKFRFKIHNLSYLHPLINERIKILNPLNEHKYVNFQPILKIDLICSFLPYQAYPVHQIYMGSRKNHYCGLQTLVFVKGA
jgi:hypothetical protein